LDNSDHEEENNKDDWKSVVRIAGPVYDLLSGPRACSQQHGEVEHVFLMGDAGIVTIALWEVG